MRAVAIGQLQTSDNNIVYRLASVQEGKYELTYTPQIMEVSLDKIEYAVKNNKIFILNMRLQGSHIGKPNVPLIYKDENGVVTNANELEQSVTIVKAVYNKGRIIEYYSYNANGKVIIYESFNLNTKDKLFNGMVHSNGESHTISVTNYTYETIDVNGKILSIGYTDKEDEQSFRYWSANEFYRYCEQRGLVYGDRDVLNLKEIDNRIRVLEIPYNIKSIYGFSYQYNDYALRILKLHTDDIDVYGVNNTHIDKIILSSRCESCDCENLRKEFRKNTNCEIIYNPNAKVLKGVLNGIANGVRVNLNDFCNLGELNSSVKSSGIEGDADLGNTVVKLYDTFVNIHYVKEDGSPDEVTPRRIKIPRTLEYMTKSFTNLSIDKLDFSEADKLYSLDESIRHVQELRVLDLSHCEGLHEIKENSISNCGHLQKLILPNSLSIIESSINNLPNLKSVELGPNIRIIRGNTFAYTGITEITIQSTLLKFATGAENLTIHYNGKSLTKDAFAKQKFKLLELDDEIEVLEDGIFFGVKGEIKFPSQLRVISRSALLEWEKPNPEVVLDLSSCTKLEKLGDQAFAQSNLIELILPDSVKEIGIKALSIKGLRKVYIPGDVKSISSKATDTMGVDAVFGTTVYTQVGSRIAGYCYANDIDTVFVKNAEEAKKYFNTKAEVPNEKKAAKLRILLQDDEQHQALLDEQYLPRAEEFLKLWIAMTSYSKIKVELNRDGFTSVPLESILSADELFTLKADPTLPTGGDSVFNSYVNFLTRFGYNLTDCLTPDCFRQFHDCEKAYDGEKKTVDHKDISIKMKHRNNMVICITFRMESVLSQRMDLYIIVLDGQAVYMIGRGNLKNATLLNIDLPLSLDEAMMPLEEALVKERTYKCLTPKVKKVPVYIQEKFIQTFREQYALVAAVLHDKASNSGEKFATAYLLSNVSGKIIKVAGKFILGSVKGFVARPNLDSFELLDIIDINNVSEEDERNIRNSYIYNTRAEIIRNNVFNIETYLSNLVSQPNAYDNLEGCVEWELSRVMQEAGNTSIDKINHKALKVLFTTAYFWKSRISYDGLMQLQETAVYNLGDGYEAVCYEEVKRGVAIRSGLIGGYERFRTIVRKVGYRPSVSGFSDKTTTCYSSSMELEKLIEHIAYLNDALLYPGYTEIDNEPAREYEFQPISSKHKLYIHQQEGTQYEFNIWLGISRGSGIPFLLTTITNCHHPVGTFKLLAYPSIEKAVDQMGWLSTHTVRAEDEIENIINYGKGFLTEFVEPSVLESNALIEARRLILMGYPNGYRRIGAVGRFFTDGAKQRAKQNNIGN